MKNIKIVIWCGEGTNHLALANKIASEFDVVGVVVDTHFHAASKKKLNHLIGLLWDHLRFRKIYDAWNKMLKRYERNFSQWPGTNHLTVGNINDPQTKSFTENLQPDLVIVSGTALIKKELLSLPLSIGIVNLHTGLSPYVRGGPNCTNWCIANNDFHLVGSTIMWLNEGIDSGNIITTETIDIKPADNLFEAHLLVMEHAHELYLRAIRYLATASAPYQSVPQESITEGNLFMTKMWTSEKKQQLLINWKKRATFRTTESPKTISLG